MYPLKTATIMLSLVEILDKSTNFNSYFKSSTLK